MYQYKVCISGILNKERGKESIVHPFTSSYYIKSSLLKLRRSLL